MSRPKRKKIDSHADESWLIPYADILTLLLALFIILFASGQIDQKKYEQIMQGFNSALNGGENLLEMPGEISIDDSLPNKNDSVSAVMTDEEIKKELEQQLQQENQDMAAIKGEIDKYILENGLSAQLGTILNDEMLIIQIQDYALFDSGSANVKPDAQKLAGVIGKMLAQYPNYHVEVVGHTDNRPINNYEFNSNWELSSQRSLNFMVYLLEKSNIDPVRFRTIGYGEYHPIASNGTAEGQAKNRRVEVNIIRNIMKATETIKP